jgi:hypothetical protein
MTDTQQDPSTESNDTIDIVGINTDKTRRTAGSETNYHVYFTLSKAPTQHWRTIFLDQWIALNTASTMPWPEVGIDGSFLFVNSPLNDVAVPYLPALKQAVAATNVAYMHHVQEEGTAQKRRENVWKDERKTVDEMAASLHFE